MKEKINVTDYANLITRALPKGILLNTNGDKFNAMVIGWGHIGTLWSKPTFHVYVRQGRYTKSQLDKTGEFTVSVPLDKPDPAINKICGWQSGYKIDKVKEAGLKLENAEVIHNDILKTDLQELSEKYNDGRPFSVVANLPYYITTPIVMTLLEKNAPVKSITVMVQKEVAERMQAHPGGKEYGALSLAVQYYAEAEIVANVPPNCFIPRPNVGSCVIRLRRCEKPRVETNDPDRMFRIIRAAFNQRRKTLANSVSNAGVITREAVTEALREMGLSETIRGEALSLAQFAELSDRLG